MMPSASIWIERMINVLCKVRVYAQTHVGLIAVFQGTNDEHKLT